jgi:hypothetical protein
MIALTEVMPEETGNRNSSLATGLFGKKLAALHNDAPFARAHRFDTSIVFF